MQRCHEVVQMEMYHGPALRSVDAFTSASGIETVECSVLCTGQEIARPCPACTSKPYIRTPAARTRTQVEFSSKGASICSKEEAELVRRKRIPRCVRTRLMDEPLFQPITLANRSTQNKLPMDLPNPLHEIGLRGFRKDWVSSDEYGLSITVQANCTGTFSFIFPSEGFQRF